MARTERAPPHRRTRRDLFASGLIYTGTETITVHVGNCHRRAFTGMTNAHPPYTKWISANGDFLWGQGVVEDYTDSLFQPEQLTGDAPG